MSEDVIASCREIEAEILRVSDSQIRLGDHSRPCRADTVLARAIRVQLRGTVKNAAIQTTICS